LPGGARAAHNHRLPSGARAVRREAPQLDFDMTRTAVAAVVALAVSIAAAAGFWFGAQRQAPASGDAAKAAPAGAPMVVEATRVMVQALPQTITTVGSLRSDESVTVRPEVAGRISDILFKEGQRVVKGVTLVRLDPAINQAEVQQARANLQLAQSKYERAVDLSQRNFISGQAKDEAENNLRVAEAAVALAAARLAKTEIKAPFAGIVGLRVVSTGDYVKEGADIVNLESIDPLKVDFRVPETYLAQVQVGQTLTVTLDALPGKTFDGSVFAVNPLIDAAGRSVVIRAVVRNSDTSLRPGMFARVRLITRDEKQALMIPEQAIVPQGDEQYVFRVVDGKASRVKVEIGQRRDAKVEIVKGLGPTDVVVTAGQLKLREGTQVTILNAAASAADARTPRNKADNSPQSMPRS
jgi:membrane fusion protein (multidrug efflux system)